MSQRVHLFGMAIDKINMSEAIGTVRRWCAAPRTAAKCRYVVTPNVDHVVMFQSDERLQAAYREASLVVADGAPVVLASRLLGESLPERVAGSDLVPALFEVVSCDTLQDEPLRVFLLGAAPGVADRAAAAIHARYSGVQVVGTLSPPIGFENDENENENILQRVAESSPDLVLIGLGAPKQELWIHRYAQQLDAKAALCIGATIDFLAGHRQRSPRWMHRVGLEWLHRMASEPSRLARRYLRDAWFFPQLVWREWRGC